MCSRPPRRAGGGGGGGGHRQPVGPPEVGARRRSGASGISERRVRTISSAPSTSLAVASGRSPRSMARNRHSGHAVHDAPGTEPHSGHRPSGPSGRLGRGGTGGSPGRSGRGAGEARPAGEVAPGRPPPSARRFHRLPAGRPPRRAAGRPRPPAGPTGRVPGRGSVVVVAARSPGTGQRRPAIPALSPAGHSAGSAAKSIISRPCFEARPLGGAALQHRGQGDPPTHVADRHHQVGARAGQRDVAALDQRQRQRQPVPAVGAADLDRRPADRCDGQRIDRRPNTSAASSESAAMPIGSSGFCRTRRIGRPWNDSSTWVIASRWPSRCRRRKSPPTPLGSSRLTVTASTAKPCSDSAVNSRRASATTIRSGVSTSRTPVIAGSASNARAAIRSASSSPTASRTVAFGRAGQPGEGRGDAAQHPLRRAEQALGVEADGLGQGQQPQASRRSARSRRRSTSKSPESANRRSSSRATISSAPGQHGQFLGLHLGHARGRPARRPGSRGCATSSARTGRGCRPGPPRAGRRRRPGSGRRRPATPSTSAMECAGSVETSRVRAPPAAQATAVAAEMVVLPTPPLPVCRAILIRLRPAFSAPSGRCPG